MYVFIDEYIHKVLRLRILTQEALAYGSWRASVHRVRRPFANQEKIAALRYQESYLRDVVNPPRRSRGNLAGMTHRYANELMANGYSKTKAP